ncbi:MAG TPA: NAD(P)/FAD-dependent oxidoreductase, partial [Gammaproteobacteria bacterium]
WFGGGVITQELTVPGFRHDRHSMAHIFIQANPLIRNDELGLLSKYGLRYIYPDMPLVSVFPDGETIGLYRDRERSYRDIERFSKKDADSYVRFSEQAANWLPALIGTLYTPPAPIGAMYAMMDQSREGREMFAVMQKSAWDVALEWFEHERVRLHFIRLVSENLIGPEEKGTGIGLFMFLGFMEKYGIGVPVGGSGTLSDALVHCIRDHGGEVMENVSVDRVIVKNGRAAGVHAEDGREFAAKDGVIGALHPHVLRKFVPGIDGKVAAAAERVQLTSNCVLTIHAALNEPLKFRAGPHVGKAMMIELLPEHTTQLRQHFDDLRYGRLPHHSLIGLGSPSNLDPGRVPPGKATMHAWDYVPYEHPDGGAARWDELKQGFAEKMLSRMQRYIDNLTPDNLIQYHVDSPLDMERTSASFLKGDIHGVAPYLYQFGAHRPTPDLGNNTVPGIDRLYLVGPFQHPGGGVFGAGRATAMKVFDDLKLDFDKVTR